jgi:hypothetical protein
VAYLLGMELSLELVADADKSFARLLAEGRRARPFFRLRLSLRFLRRRLESFEILAPLRRVVGLVGGVVELDEAFDGFG